MPSLRAGYPVDNLSLEDGLYVYMYVCVCLCIYFGVLRHSQEWH